MKRSPHRISVLTIGFQKVLVTPEAFPTIHGLLPLKATYNSFSDGGEGWSFTIDKVNVVLEFFPGEALKKDDEQPEIDPPGPANRGMGLFGNDNDNINPKRL